MKNVLKDIFKKKSDPLEYISDEFERAKVVKNVSVDQMKGPSGRILKVLLKYYKYIITGKKNKESADYLKGIYATGGDYANRDRNIQKGVLYAQNYCEEAIKTLKSSNPSKVDPMNTPAGILIRCINILFSSKWKKAFGKAFKVKNKRKTDTSQDFIVILYSCLTFTAEYLGLMLKLYEDDLIDSDPYVVYKALNDFCKENRTFTVSVLGSMAQVLPFMEKTNDPLKMVNDLMKAEQEAQSRLSSNESESEIMHYGRSSLSEDAYNALGEEAVGITAATMLTVATGVGYALLAIGGLVAVIAALRMAVYYVGCMKINIAKSYEETAEMLTFNISKLEQRLETINPDSAEYDKLVKIIEKQKKLQVKYEQKAHSVLNQDIAIVRDIEADHDTDDSFIDDFNDVSIDL